MYRNEVLSKAEEAVVTRDHTYGHPGQSFAEVAQHWSIILGVSVTPEQVILCMTALKINRLSNTPNHADSWVDLAGYAALGGEISSTTPSNEVPFEVDVPAPVPATGAISVIFPDLSEPSDADVVDDPIAPKKVRK